MVAIAVTGASGAVGKRLTGLLVDRVDSGESAIDRVVAIDRRQTVRSLGRDRSADGVETYQLDVVTDDLGPAMEGCHCVVHLVEDPARRAEPGAAAVTLDRVLSSATAAGVDHVVLLSSALVYGASPDNPVPLTEVHPVRPVPALAYATIKADLEAQATEWAAATSADLAILRPTATLSDGDSSWIGAALRAATSVRPERVDPPVQFLHHDDLASALLIAVEQRLTSIYNVAPDGWIGSELFRALRGEADVRLPEQLSEWRLRLVKSLANRSLLDGLEPYVTYPWVVSNDKLRSVGWEPKFSNEEAFVAGTPPPLLASINPQRRQELALGAVGAVGAAALGTAIWVVRRTVR